MIIEKGKGTPISVEKVRKWEGPEQDPVVADLLLSSTFFHIEHRVSPRVFAPSHTTCISILR